MSALDRVRGLRAKAQAAEAEPHSAASCRLFCGHCRRVGDARRRFEEALARLPDADFRALLAEAQEEARAALGIGGAPCRGEP